MKWLIVFLFVSFTRMLFKGVSKALERSAQSNTPQQNRPIQRVGNTQQMRQKAKTPPKQITTTQPKKPKRTGAGAPLTSEDWHKPEEQGHWLCANELQRAVIWSEILKRKF